MKAEHIHLWDTCFREECIPHDYCTVCGIDPEDLDK